MLPTMNSDVLTDPLFMYENRYPMPTINISDCTVNLKILYLFILFIPLSLYF